MNITLTPEEVQFFAALQTIGESLEQAFHRVLAPMVEKKRLTLILAFYGGLTPDDRREVLGVLKNWQATKGAK